MKKPGNATSKLAVKGKELVVSCHLLPDAPITDWDSEPPPMVHNLFENFNPDAEELVFTRVVPEFLVPELKLACKRLSAGKAGGPSGIPNEILRHGVLAHPHRFAEAYNVCLRSLHFPSCWKRSKLVLLHKGPGKPLDVPSSYRPICLLDTPGKLLERLLVQRLESHFDARGALGRAPNQYGFRKGVSTESAVDDVLKVAAKAAYVRGQTKDLCVLIMLDVKNVFNTLR